MCLHCCSVAVYHGVILIRTYDAADAEDDNGYWALARSSLLSDPKELLRMLLEFDKDALDIRTIAAIQVLWID